MNVLYIIILYDLRYMCACMQISITACDHGHRQQILIITTHYYTYVHNCTVYYTIIIKHPSLTLINSYTDERTAGTCIIMITRSGCKYTQISLITLKVQNNSTYHNNYIIIQKQCYT